MITINTRNEPGEKSHGLGTQHKIIRQKQNYLFFFPDEFGLRCPVIGKKIAKKRYTSIAARANP